MASQLCKKLFCVLKEFLVISIIDHVVIPSSVPNITEKFGLDFLYRYSF